MIIIKRSHQEWNVYTIKIIFNIKFPPMIIALNYPPYLEIQDQGTTARYQM
jgi:hypothetical protein